MKVMVTVVGNAGIVLVMVMVVGIGNILIVGVAPMISETS